MHIDSHKLSKPFDITSHYAKLKGCGMIIDRNWLLIELSSSGLVDVAQARRERRRPVVWAGIMLLFGNGIGLVSKYDTDF
jgi:hypothetical protein